MGGSSSKPADVQTQLAKEKVKVLITYGKGTNAEWVRAKKAINAKYPTLKVFGQKGSNDKAFTITLDGEEIHKEGPLSEEQQKAVLTAIGEKVAGPAETPAKAAAETPAEEAAAETPAEEAAAEPEAAAESEEAAAEPEAAAETSEEAAAEPEAAAETSEEAAAETSEEAAAETAEEAAASEEGAEKSKKKKGKKVVKGKK